MDISLREMTAQERLYAYPQSQQLRMQCGEIGQLRGDFGKDGNQFFSTWTDFVVRYKSAEFQAELDAVINALREDSQYGGLLQSRSAAERYCAAHPGSAFMGGVAQEYGFRVDTPNHAYLLRCNARAGDANFYVFPYVSKWLDKHIERAQEGIRFIDSRYNELFRIPDGGRVRLTHSDGSTDTCVCRYIDQTHLELGRELYHNCQLAELLERNGTSCSPVDETVPQGAAPKKRQDRGR